MSESTQYAMAVLMIRPARFGFNPETAASNAFQKCGVGSRDPEIQSAALAEFDRALNQLVHAGVDVLALNDSPEPARPDAVFPNNWISTHGDGTIITYPMLSPIRRREIRDDIIDAIGKRFLVARRWALEGHAESGRFLEGTGSLVLDRVNRIAFACRSPRTDEALVREFCRQMDYSPVVFDAVDATGKAIYHTNVMMSVLEESVVVCTDSVARPEDKGRLLEAMESCGRAVIEISLPQMEEFSCNLLQIGRRGHSPVVAISSTSDKALNRNQRRLLEKDSELLALDIPVIERCGGGSVRCMLCEIFLPPH
jgi:hypothetical protein